MNIFMKCNGSPVSGEMMASVTIKAIEFRECPSCSESIPFLRTDKGGFLLPHYHEMLRQITKISESWGELDFDYPDYKVRVIEESNEDSPTTEDDEPVYRHINPSTEEDDEPETYTFRVVNPVDID
jgi:hypothetical protein